LRQFNWRGTCGRLTWTRLPWHGRWPARKRRGNWRELWTDERRAAVARWSNAERWGVRVPTRSMGTRKTTGPKHSLEPASPFCYRYACPVWQAARGRGKISWSPLKKGDRHLTTIVFRGVFICPFGASPPFSTGCWAGASCLESDHVEMAAPKGANSKAQGNALGNRTTLKPVALKGRDVLPREASVSPFQGYRRSSVSAFPGRCPGLSSLAPSGQRECR